MYTKSYIIIRLIILRKAYNMFYNNASEMLYEIETFPIFVSNCNFSEMLKINLGQHTDHKKKKNNAAAKS